MALPRLNGYYGEGDDPVALHNLDCSGNENDLTSWSSASVPVGTSHEIDAGVFCYTADSE